MAISVQRALLIVAVLFLWTSESQQTPAIQAAALSQFFDATNGPAWVSYCSSLWQSSSPPCSWFGVMCDNVSNVIGLGLVGCNLQGALPMSLEDISTLQFLTLTNNAITKPLPQWTQLGSLLSLALGNNLVNDTLPDSWAALTSLQDFDMSNNPLTSTLPVSWGSKMTNLRRVDLSNASIQGLLPGTWCRVFSGLLNLSHNQLTQLEDFDDYQNCTSIGNLDISWNAFYYNMALPFWGSIQNGGNIYASHNTLSMIPCHWRMYGNTLDLSWNMFGYSTAPNNCGFGAFLHTNLAHNNFYTYLDAITSQFFSIYSLDLSGNRFYGYLPTQNPALFAGDCNCNSCFLNVGNNELSGAVPEYYCTLPATLNYAGNPYMTNATVCTTNQMCPWIE